MAGYPVVIGACAYEPYAPGAGADIIGEVGGLPPYFAYLLASFCFLLYSLRLYLRV